MAVQMKTSVCNVSMALLPEWGQPAAIKYFLLKQIVHGMSCSLSHYTHSCWVFSVRWAKRALRPVGDKYPSFDKWPFSSPPPLLFNRSLQETTTAVISLNLTSPSTVLISRSKFSSWGMTSVAKNVVICGLPYNFPLYFISNYRNV